MFKFVASIITVLACLGAVSASPTTGHQARQNTGPTGFNITSLGINGSGCPQGSAIYTMTAESSGVIITFSKYFAQVGPGISISDNRKNCQLTLGVRVPSGFSFGLVNIDYRGFYQLENQVTATQQAIYYFQGDIKQSAAKFTLTGPITGGDYTFRNSFDLTNLVLSPCGATTILNIDSDISTNNANNQAGTGFISQDSIGAAFTQTFNFQWQKC